MALARWIANEHVPQNAIVIINERSQRVRTAPVRQHTNLRTLCVCVCVCTRCTHYRAVIDRDRPPCGAHDRKHFGPLIYGVIKRWP